MLFKVGSYESFLWRRGKIFEFCESKSQTNAGIRELDCTIGARERILVDVATLSVQPRRFNSFNNISS